MISIFGEQKMKVKVISRRTIKPANDVFMMHPGNLLPLSSADFAVPSYHVNVIYAFEAPTPPTSVLEDGLAKILSEFRELAGRFTEDQKGRLAIELNDEGATLVEAIADGIFADAMPFDPSPFLVQLFPPTPNCVPELLLIQLTRFACGGLAIGVAWHHRVADLVGLCAFMDSWSRVVRGQSLQPLPVRDRSLLMARDPPRPVFDHIEYAILRALPAQRCDPCSSEIVTKRIHFGAELLNRIKRIASQDAEKPYTQFESLTAYFWRCVTMARGLNGEVVTRIGSPVNVRNRLNPPLPSQYFGNAAFLACPQTTVNELLGRPLHFAANLVHDAIARIGDEYVRSALDFLELHPRHGGKAILTDDVRLVSSPHLLPSSWMNFPLYELDFGWGRPSYAGPLLLPVEGASIFIPSYTKDGSIDIIVSMFEADLAKLEQICFTL